jgi:GxxExxY protein
MENERDRLNRLSNVAIGCALRVHKELGPGMLESAYEACLMFELLERGLKVEREKALPLVYRGRRLDCGYRLDLLAEDAIIIEVKAVQSLNRVHSSQLLSYLRQSGLHLGLLINFNVKWLRDGIKRIVNRFPE